MTQAGESVLAALVAPRSVDEFLTQYWPEKAFVGHGDPARLPLFLRAPELESIEALSKKYRGSMRFTNGRKYQKMVAVDQTPAVSLYRMGLTVQCEDVAPYVELAPASLRRLEAELGVNPGAAQFCAFASPVSEGLSVHFDAQDLFSIQLRGAKRFHIAPVKELRFPSGIQFVPGTEPFDDLYPQVGNGFPDASGADFTTVEMKPGSVLFVPRGTWHYTESEGDSMSVSIGLYTPSAVDHVLRQLRLLLLQDPDWRRPLYGAWGSGPGHAAAAARAAQLLAGLPEFTRRLNVDDLMASLLPPEQRLAAITKKSRFQKSPHSRVETEISVAMKNNSHEALAIKISDPNYGERVTARLEIPPQAAAALRWVGDRQVPFTAGELASRFPALAFAEHQKILKIAAEKGLVKMLWFPALDLAPRAQG